MNDQRAAEREAARLLKQVGGRREWWHWNLEELVGHLRIGLTPDELTTMPTGCAIHDAGFVGTERLRRRSA